MTIQHKTHHQTNTTGSYLRPKAAAEHLGIGLSTLWRFAKEYPDFPQPKKIGERITLFDAKALNQWVEDQKS